ncbi:HalOD1 output domain-containing protein [Halorussus rarus]|uniref:HalOD1 output domain-containing protein n=1 Tax=Halorussus TaxID=1070314 RepID=UPI000E20F64B|nr:HalOD1 output domain-containing protein [Halorussus rarus]NHN59871.1 hypothetical protein [Halorussus sp. JP-T4]
MTVGFGGYDRSEPTYDPETDSYRLDYDPEADRDVVTLAVLAVADVLDADPTDIRPLAESVDPDDLARAIRLRDDGEASLGNVTFPLGDCRVTVTKDAVIRIEKLAETA